MCYALIKSSSLCYPYSILLHARRMVGGELGAVDCLRTHITSTVMRFRKPKKKGRDGGNALVVRNIFKIGTSDPCSAKHL